MKRRILLIISVITFSGLAFSACTDESENIVPQPLEVEEAAATVVPDHPEHDPM